MGGNSFGQRFRITTFGESHGEGVGTVIDGCPPGIRLSEEDFTFEMGRRRPGRHKIDTPRQEQDSVEILSGIFEGMTTGTPITLFIRNLDVHSKPYEILRELYRPGHADYSYHKKYGHFDFRGGGRASARETAARVAAGVLARLIIHPIGVRVTGYTLELGGVRVNRVDPAVINTNPLYCPDANAVDPMMEAIRRAKQEGDSVGGVVEILVSGCPAGLGEPVFDKLSGDLAKAVMSVGAVKGFEIGAGFEAARLKGSENNDPLTPSGFTTNNAGGILGGISSGEDIVLRAAVKPIPSIAREQETIDRKGRPAKIKMPGRFDTCAVPRIVPVLEAMVAIVLADHCLRAREHQKRG
jgi:chorismate synthase